ncbi:hypothetical protein [Argonema antarcticum]|uniref:hypothetical protein n=1 Tax=Argonema antarcticum TaxID=2942763 RepID=UPI0020138E68|nr:hypothetical protein [Argonema antarcticum]MCL1469946.1 hypothetical protein [Argonema antarcticum A004/B2]
MQRIFSSLKQAIRNSLVAFSLISFISLSALFLFTAGPSLAAAPVQSQPTIEKGIDNANEASEGTVNRAAAYEKAVKAVDEQGLEKVYEKNLEEYEETQPDTGIIKEAKQLIEKVTGQD